MLIFSLGLRNALRNRRRSALTALTVTLGVALLTVAMAWLTGILGDALDDAANLAGHVRIVSAEYARREQLNPLDRNLPVTAPLEAAIAALPGTVAAYPHITMGVTATVGEDIGERFGLVHGAPLAFYEGPLQLPQHLLSGRMLVTDNEALIGKKLVEQLGAKLGDDVILLGQTQDGSMSPAKVTLVGILDLGNAMQNRQVFLTLDKVRYMVDIPDGAVEILAYASDRGEARALAEAIAALPDLAGKDVKAWDQRPPFDGVLGILYTVQAIAAGVIVFITALGVLNTMLMSVMERTAEIGVMRAMGLRRIQVVQLFFLESVGISAVGGVAGALLGGAAAQIMHLRGINLGSVVDKLPSSMPISATVYPRLTPEILGGAVLLGLLMAVVGGVVPAYRASLIQPIEAMRSRH